MIQKAFRDIFLDVANAYASELILIEIVYYFFVDQPKVEYYFVNILRIFEFSDDFVNFFPLNAALITRLSKESILFVEKSKLSAVIGGPRLFWELQIPLIQSPAAAAAGKLDLHFRSSEHLTNNNIFLNPSGERMKIQ